MSDSNPPARRSARRWAILLIAWLIGIPIGAIYLAMFFAMLYRWFGSN